MSNFTTVPDETIKEMKCLNDLINQIDEMEVVFGRSKETDDSFIIRRDAKIQLSNLIQSL